MAGGPSDFRFDRAVATAMLGGMMTFLSKIAAAYVMASVCVFAAISTCRAGDERFYDRYPAPANLKAGDALRKELFEVLRPIHERFAKKKAKFTGRMWVQRHWAVFAGSSVDEKGTPIAEPGSGNTEVAALWLKTFQGWVVVDYGFGHSDVFWVDWPESYGVPQTLVEKLTSSGE
jgi:hypothetical protein